MSKFTIVGLGELLWDVFPTHKQLGGAPANFAYISSLLGEDALVVSRIGQDALGAEVMTRLQGLGLDCSCVQHDAARATGTVNVELASDGQPRFDITKEVAWDFLEWTPQLQQLAQRADAVCFGSLAQRRLQSRETIQRFVDGTRAEAVRVFDVNLRQAFYSTEVLNSSAQKATILKLNHEEVPTMMKSVGGPATDELRSAQWLCRKFGVKLVCITRGGSGSLLVNKDSHAEHPGFRITVADTVGAGDAFTATLVHHYLRSSDLPTMNEAANRIGSWVASKSGATPAPEPEVIRHAQLS